MRKLAKSVCKILTQHKNCADIETVRLSHHIFHDLNLDSLDVMHIISLLEKEYDIVFPDKYIDCVRYVYEMVYMIGFRILYQRLLDIKDCVIQYYSDRWLKILWSLDELRQRLETYEFKMFQWYRNAYRKRIISSYHRELSDLCSNLPQKLRESIIIGRYLHKAIYSVQFLDSTE